MDAKTVMVLFWRRAGALVFEEYEHAIAEEQNILRNRWWWNVSRRSSFTAPHPEGLGAKNVMIKLFERCWTKPTD